MILCGLALLLALSSSFIRPSQTLSIEAWTPLFEALPSSLHITQADGKQFSLDSSGTQAYLRDHEGSIIGLAVAADIKDLHKVLRDCTVMHRRPLSEVSQELRQQWGLDQAVTLRLGDLHYAFGSAGTDRGYCLFGDEVLICSTDPAPLMQRPMTAFRPSVIPLPDYIKEIRHDDGWRAYTHDGRWWIDLPGKTKRWPHDERLLYWLRQLANAKITGYLSDYENKTSRAGLACHGTIDGNETTVNIADLDPTSQPAHALE